MAGVNDDVSRLVFQLITKLLKIRYGKGVSSTVGESEGYMFGGGHWVAKSVHFCHLEKKWRFFRGLFG